MISQIEIQNELRGLIEFQLSERKTKEANPSSALLDLRMEVVNTPSVIDYAAYCEYQAAQTYIAGIKSYGAGLCSELIQEKNRELITTNYLSEVITYVEAYNTSFYRALNLLTSPTDWYESIVGFVSENLSIRSLDTKRKKAFQVLQHLLPSGLSSDFYLLPENIVIAPEEGSCTLRYGGTSVDPEGFVFPGCYIGNAKVLSIEGNTIFTEGTATGSAIFFPFFVNPPTPISITSFGSRETIVRSLASSGLLPSNDPSVKVCIRALRITGFEELEEGGITLDYPKHVQSALTKIKDTLRRNGFPYGYDRLIQKAFNLNTAPEEDDLLNVIAEIAEFADTRSMS